METSCSLHPHVIPAIAQLVEHLTVDCAEIRWSLARFRVAGLLYSHPPTPFKGNVSVCGAVGPCILPVCTPMFQCACGAVGPCILPVYTLVCRAPREGSTLENAGRDDLERFFQQEYLRKIGVKKAPKSSRPHFLDVVSLCL